jgi:hypothetical protein
MLRTLYAEETSVLPIGQEAGQNPEPIWTIGEEKNLLPLPGTELRTISLYPLCIPSELSHLYENV